MIASFFWGFITLIERFQKIIWGLKTSIERFQKINFHCRKKQTLY